MNAPLPIPPAAADSAGALTGLGKNADLKQIDSNVPGGFGATLQDALSSHTGGELPGRWVGQATTSFYRTRQYSSR